jgi:hypothetical protein
MTLIGEVGGQVRSLRPLGIWGCQVPIRHCSLTDFRIQLSIEQGFVFMLAGR